MKLIIKQDTDAQAPNEFDDAEVFLVAGHRQFFVRPPEFAGSGQPAAFHLVKYIESKADTHWTFPLEAYIHSGVVLALSGEGNFPDRQWDVSRCGAVLVAKEHWTEDKARTAALGLVETWNQYLSGDVWGVIIEDDQGNHMDSCWGFYGREYAETEGQAMLAQAEKHSFDPVI